MWLADLAAAQNQIPRDFVTLSLELIYFRG